MLFTYIQIRRYNVQWYRTPLHVQKIILFLLQRDTKKFTLNIGGIIEGSVERFATVNMKKIILITHT